MLKKMKLKKNSRDLQDAIFFASMVIIPTIQFIIFYICVKINTVTLSFKVYDPQTQSFNWDFTKNFSDFFYNLSTTKIFTVAIKNSLVASIFTVGFGIIIGLIFSLYIYRKQFGHKIFKVLLFMPSVVSSIVMATVFSKLADNAYPELMNQWFGIKVNGLFADLNTRWGILIFYALWSGFGSPILLYVGAMSGISESVSEAAKLDGCNIVKESWYVTLPLIYPTIIVYITTGLATIFVNQLNLYSFYGGAADPSIQTMGYWFYTQTANAEGMVAAYPYLSAVGLFFTFLALPMTFGGRWFMTKIGPKTE